jgi:hypothetical protein
MSGSLRGSGVAVHPLLGCIPARHVPKSQRTLLVGHTFIMLLDPVPLPCTDVLLDVLGEPHCTGAGSGSPQLPQQ